jgi:hypothetical protein
MFQTITEPNVCNILGVDKQMSTVDFRNRGVTKEVPVASGEAANLPAADEVDDLQAVPFGQAGLCPLIAGNDAAIQFYGYAIGFHSQMVDKTSERERSAEVPRFAIDVQLHVLWIFAASAAIGK